MREIVGVPRDNDKVVGDRGGGDEAVENRKAATIALMPGAEMPPFAKS